MISHFQDIHMFHFPVSNNVNIQFKFQNFLTLDCHNLGKHLKKRLIGWKRTITLEADTAIAGILIYILRYGSYYVFNTILVSYDTFVSKFVG